MFEVKEMKYAISHEEGISVLRLNRYVWIYEDSGRVLYLGADSGTGKDGQYYSGVVFPKDLRWQRPYDNEVVDEERKALIKSHFREAITALIPDSIIEFFDEKV